MAADVRIDIAAQFVGKKAFKEADTATEKLTKNVKKLAGAVGLAYGTSAVIAYGKASVKAFAEDEKAALRLTRAVENLGIGFANPAIADYIGNLEKSAAIADDILRPAFQSLLTTTGSLTQSQKLLNDAITISRASGVDLATVTQDLAKGYVGVTRGLIKYNTGLTRAELQSKSFNEILGVILKRSAGAAEDYLGSTAYSMDVLGIATGNASEIIGGGLVDALALVGGGTDATDAAYVIENIATALSKVTVQAGRTIGVIPTLIKNLKNLPRNIFQGFAGAQLGVNVVIPEKKEEVKLTLTQKKQEELLAKLEKDSLKREKERLALKNKQLATDKAKAIIAKGENALLKGNEVFDMDKIQLAAALTNQAEQLGRTTSASQQIQIANDTARLNVKRSMLILEEAIALKDEDAIIAATKKLNADLGVLNALTGQNTQMKAIESILKGLNPKSLIDIDNLKEALRLLGEINLAQTGSKKAPSTVISGGKTVAGAGVGAVLGMTMEDEHLSKLAAQAISNMVKPTLTNTPFGEGGMFNLEDVARSSLLQGLAGGAGVSGAVSGSRYAAQAANAYNITINTGVGDPNAIAEAIDNVLREARDRGTLVAV